MRKNGSMKTQLDVHTHTVASGHAYSTIQEMATAAAHMGLKILGITEHGPSIPARANPSISGTCIACHARCMV